MSYPQFGNVSLGNLSGNIKLYINNSGEGNISGIGYNSNCLTFGVNQAVTATPEVVINQFGNVGIGTTNPLTTLDVSGSLSLGNLSGNIKLYINNSGAGNISGIGYNSNCLTFGVNQAVTAIPDVVINQFGNVGIGTTTPTVALDVIGSIKSLNLPQCWNSQLLGDTMKVGTYYYLLGTFGDWNSGVNYGCINIKGTIGGWTSNLACYIDCTITTRGAASYSAISVTGICRNYTSDVTTVADIVIYYIGSTVGTGQLSGPQYYVYLVTKVNYNMFNLTVDGNNNNSNSVALYQPSLTISTPTGTVVTSSILTTVANNITMIGSKVGIGTTSPGTYLDVSNEIAIKSTSSTISYAQTSTLGFGYGGGSVGTKYRWKIDDITLNRDGGTGPNYDYGAQSKLIFSCKSNGLYNGTANDTAYIQGLTLVPNSTGSGSLSTGINVGIGTTVPQTLLEIMGTPLNGASTNANHQWMFNMLRPGTGSVQNATSFGIRHGAFDSGIAACAKTVFLISGPPVAANTYGYFPDISAITMQINNSGALQVGIGTTSPAYTLDVGGPSRICCGGLGTSGASIAFTGVNGNYTTIDSTGSPTASVGLGFAINGTESMRINAGGTLLLQNVSNVGSSISTSNGNFLSIEAYVATNTATKYPVCLAAYGGNVGIGTTITRGRLHVNYNGTYNGMISENCPAVTNTARDTMLPPLANSSILGPAASDSSFFVYWKNSAGTKYYFQGTGTVLFTGQHMVVPDNPEIQTNLTEYVGLIISSNDTGYTSYYNGIKSTGIDAIRICEALPNCKLSDKDNDKAVFGVITNQKNDEYFDTDGSPLYDNIDNGFEKSLYDRVRVNSVGEGSIWVTNINGSLENGDYITSSAIPGYGKRQNDDLLHNYTVAKTTMSCDFVLNSPNYKTKNIVWEGNTYIAAFIGCTYHCG